ncbi:amidohydrolase family protein, partial [bacterium]|nr:amidohydrolase family protein [bacterium]
MIDAHVHFWRLDRGEYDWITPERTPLRQDYLPHHFLSTTEQTKVRGCIAVQAAPTRAETDFLLNLTAQNDCIRGVTGWADLTAPTLEKDLDIWNANPTLKGIRPMGVMLGPEWLNQTQYHRGIKVLAERNLILEALVLPHHLRAVAAIAKAHPDLQIVINHAAKPLPEDLPNWRVDLSSFSQLKNVTCKLSGLTQQSSDLDHHKSVLGGLMDVFGPGRLMWG